ncbi:MAG TPA: DUF2950 domain-containing protein [Candidatus Sulfotelmatobacter sp.]|jgi:hypothetical protein|nr:DUF2950 domain-containing protein [Candidatus Sulfotelmatobacter sp.]
MRVGNLSFGIAGCGSLLKLAAVAVLLAGSFAAPSMGQQPGQKTFSSPEDASKALYAAAKGNDEKVVIDLLGPEGREVVSSGDEAEDAQARANFVKRYEEMSRLVKEPDGSVTLYIGPHNWPFPISLVNKGNVWYFNTTAAKQEILFRRIGRNEVSAIHVCRELVAAQREYYTQQNSEYARKIFSEEGKHDGLYWKTSENQPRSPIGPLVAHAVLDEETKNRGAQPVPFRGYYFHILTGQGKNAVGGAKSYVADGKMTGGFAFIAYPADYRSSGVMTFLVNEDGVVYEKDLGNKTASLGMSIREYNPDSSWKKSEPDQQTASSGKTAK